VRVRRLPGVGARVRADRNLLFHAAYNLLSNSMIRSDSGSVVTIGAERTTAGGLRLVISDRAAAIDPKVLPHAFDRFHQAAISRAPVGGNGVGLALVRQVVQDLHGGRTFAENGDGEVRFGFELSVQSVLTPEGRAA
jgi:two-component system heavy metal sensor histidine kinase CusS